MTELLTETVPGIDAQEPDESAPHGRDPMTGDPLAPYGYREDGKPRLSNRGRRPGGKATAPKRKARTRASGGAPKKAAAGPDYKSAAAGLVGLGSVPFQVAGTEPIASVIRRFVGEKYVKAARGNAAIIAMFADPLSDAVAGIAEVNPDVARRLETSNIKLPYVVALKTGMDLLGALVANTVNPSDELAETGEKLLVFQSQQIRAQIEAMTRAEEDAKRARAEEEADEREAA